jgi:uncharacterized protein (DUF1684 family)
MLTGQPLNFSQVSNAAVSAIPIKSTSSAAKTDINNTIDPFQKKAFQVKVQCVLPSVPPSARLTPAALEAVIAVKHQSKLTTAEQDHLKTFALPDGSIDLPKLKQSLNVMTVPTVPEERLETVYLDLPTADRTQNVTHKPSASGSRLN